MISCRIVERTSNLKNIRVRWRAQITTSFPVLNVCVVCVYIYIPNYVFDKFKNFFTITFMFLKIIHSRSFLYLLLLINSLNFVIADSCHTMTKISRNVKFFNFICTAFSIILRLKFINYFILAVEVNISSTT